MTAIAVILWAVLAVLLSRVDDFARPEDRAVYPDRPWFRPVPACPEGPPAGWVGRCEQLRAWEGRR